MKLLSIKDKDIIVFTDGSSRGNPGRGGYGAVTIYPDAHGQMCVDELGGREDLTTNNRMELRAVIEAIKNFVGFNMYVDSKYVLQGATAWIHGWKKNNWTTAGGKEDVKNRDLWEDLDELISKYKIRSKWNLIEGHAGVFGNERCDVIATAFADDKDAVQNFKLFTGSLASYQASTEGKDILNLEAVNQDAKDKLKARKKSGSSAKAFSYISMVDGKIETHKTWKECEERVKGKSKARFKKATSQSDEGEIISSFRKS